MRLLLLLIYLFFLRTYTALETLTEPHQVVSTLSCVTVVSRTLLSGKRYTEGPGHLLMLLRLALPGIDPNDFRKMLVREREREGGGGKVKIKDLKCLNFSVQSSSLLISSLASLVPLVDCSSAIGHVEMTQVN